MTRLRWSIVHALCLWLGVSLSLLPSTVAAESGAQPPARKSATKPVAKPGAKLTKPTTKGISKHASKRAAKHTRKKSKRAKWVPVAASGATLAAAAESSPHRDPNAPPVLAARAWLLLDANSGAVLSEQAADRSVEPASLTKLMTLYVSFKALREGRVRLEQKTRVTDGAWKSEGSRMFLDPRHTPSLAELISGVIVQSGNDAALTLAEAVAGSPVEMVKQMNVEALRLGMTQSHFVNVTGLPQADHVSTARDLARLAQAVVNDFPEYYDRFAAREFTYNGITQANRNRLLWFDPHVDGLKTGHTQSAGYCLIASAKRDQRRLISVVLGAGTDAARNSESLRLLNYGFARFDTVKLYPAQQVVSRLAIYHGVESAVPVGFVKDFYVTLPRDAGSLKAEIVRREPLLAPFVVGQTVAQLKVSAGDNVLGEFPLLALQEVKQTGFLGRVIDNLRLRFQAWLS